MCNVKEKCSNTMNGMLLTPVYYEKLDNNTQLVKLSLVIFSLCNLKGTASHTFYMSFFLELIDTLFKYSTSVKLSTNIFKYKTI